MGRPLPRLPYLWTPAFRGKICTYYRRGDLRVRLPNRTDPGFLAAYTAAHTAAETPRRAGPTPGTVAATIAAYRASPEWRGLAPASRTDYDKALRPLEELLGDLRIAAIKRGTVFELRDRFSTMPAVTKHKPPRPILNPDGTPMVVDTPRRANRMVAVLRILLGWAHNRGLIKENVALRPGTVKQSGEGYATWTVDQLRAFLAHPDVPAGLQLAAGLGFWTGQRKEDCLAVTWGQRRDGALHIVQLKTGAAMVIPEHPELAALLDRAPRTAPTILARPDGASWREDHFNKRFAEAVKAAGLAGLSFHGLRKGASAHLVESGASDAEADAILGHRDARMTQRYRRGANQASLARAAVARISKE